MFAERFRRTRKLDRDGRRRVATSGIEALEGRQLLTYSPIGSLPQLVVSGQAGAIAAYGGPITVTLDVSNQGASSMVEPLNLEPGATSTADAAPGRVGVYLLKTRNTRPGGAGSVLLGDIETPTIQQNSLVRITDTLTLPSRPRSFPGSGGKVFLGFRPQGSLRQKNGGSPVPVLINAGLPDLAAIDIDLPSTIQPGDTVAPALKIANYGTVNTNTQGNVTVLLVASTDLNYGPTDVVLAQYVITSLPGLSEAPSTRVVLGDVNLDNPPNLTTLTTTFNGSKVATLPPGQSYYIGVIVDPLNQIRELNEIGRGSSSELRLVRRVQIVPGLPPAGILTTLAPVDNVFPIPAYAPLTTLGDFLTSASTVSTATVSQSSSLTNATRALGTHKAKATRNPVLRKGKAGNTGQDS